MINLSVEGDIVSLPKELLAPVADGPDIPLGANRLEGTLFFEPSASGVDPLAPPLGQADIRVFLSTDQTLDASDLVVAEAGSFFLLPATEPSTSRFFATANIAEGTPNADYYLIFQVDPDNDFEESVETDNIFVTASTYTLTDYTFVDPDLQVVDVTTRFVEVTQPGFNAFSLRYSILNDSGANSRPPDAVDVAFFLSDDDSLDSDDQLLARQTVALTNGAASQIDAPIDYDDVAGLSEDQSIIVVLDPDNAIVEADETNNTVVEGPLDEFVTRLDLPGDFSADLQGTLNDDLTFDWTFTATRTDMPDIDTIPYEIVWARGNEVGFPTTIEQGHVTFENGSDTAVFTGTLELTRFPEFAYGGSLIARIDPNDTVGEGPDTTAFFLTNNQSVVSTNIPSGPVSVVTDYSLDLQAPGRDQTTVTLANTTDSDLTDVSFQLVASRDKTFDDDDIILGSTVLPLLPAVRLESDGAFGATEVRTPIESDPFDFVVPEGVSGGPYFILKVVNGAQISSSLDQVRFVDGEEDYAPLVINGQVLYEENLLFREIKSFGPIPEEVTEFEIYAQLTPNFDGTTFTQARIIPDLDFVYSVWVDGSDKAENYDLLSGPNLIQAGGGSDTINGGVGEETLDGGVGNDTVSGNAGEDTVLGNGGDDLLDGGDGNDHVEGGFGFDTLDGGDGNDSMAGGAGADSLLGGDGADEIFGNSGLDTVYAGAGDDFVSGGFSTDLIHGDEGNDELQGRSGADTLFGGAGNDTLLGSQGRDEIHGGANSDEIFGATAADTLYGDAGRDTIFGSEGRDVLFGGDGNDELSGGSGSDLVNGDAGNDEARGNTGADTVNGGDGNDSVFGGTGSDRVNGDAGDDLVAGQNGADTLDGGAGNDTLRGGAGSDIFVFNSESGADVIQDFDVTLEPDLLQFSTSLTGGLTEGATIIAAFADDSGPEVVFDFGEGNQVTLQGVSALDGLAELTSGF